MTQIRLTLGGNLKNHETFYFSDAGEILVEKEHRYLVDAIPEEKEEIYRLMPFLKKVLNEEGGAKL